MARLASAALLMAALLWPAPAAAHFLELIPGQDIVEQADDRTVRLALAFTHPMMGGPAMAMERPIRFGVLGPRGDEDLTATLASHRVDGEAAFHADYTLRRPGDHVFYVQPAPYWEPAEGVMIIHYTKVVVAAFGGGGGWDGSVGFPVEIEPLVRPYGLWTGNLFRGVVTRNGAPVPFAEVEVEWRNDGSVTPPAEPYVTQVIKADADGVFAYAMPRAGWWGFAALMEGAETLVNPAGEAVPVEQGALMWVHTRDMK